MHRRQRAAATGLYQPRLTELSDTQGIIDAPYGLFAAPRRAVARDRKQIVGRGGIAAVGHRGRRRYADRGDRAGWSIDPYRRMEVIVPVQDQVDAVSFEQRKQRLRIGQPLDA